MSNTKLRLSLLPELFAVCQLNPGTAIPDWAVKSPFFSITRTADELSIVCQQGTLPVDVKAERDWRCLQVEGPLDFALTGILAMLTTPLAEANICIFAIATFDTDYLLIKETAIESAIKTLRAAGHTINS